MRRGHRGQEARMDLRRLGRTGAPVTELCLGTMTFGKETDEGASHAIIDAYVDAGGDFIDTADVYQQGTSEEFIGSWLARSGRRDDIVLATKARFPLTDDPADGGLSRTYLMRAVDASLRRLRVDWIDLHQAHCWDPATPLEETLETYADLVRAGKVRYFGVSNFSGWQLQRAILFARGRGASEPVTLQPQYNLLAREIEWELVPLCLDEGIGLLPWSPLGGGWLTGKYTRERDPHGATRLGEDPGRGVEAWERRNTDRTWAIVDAVREIASERAVSMSQVALNWVTHRPGVTSTILGVRTVDQLRDNLGAVGWRLEPEQQARLDEVSAPLTPDYPYRFIDDSTASRRALVAT
jgi:aryl-alcohol dehydrogenase-like predicted oxidoreductase